MADRNKTYDGAAAELLLAPPPSADASVQRGRVGTPREIAGWPSRARFCHAFMRSHSCGNSERDVPLSAPPLQPENAAAETDEDALSEKKL